jgi:nitrogen fixation-related uncharacterized protein
MASVVTPPQPAHEGEVISRSREGLLKSLFIVGFGAFILIGGGMGFFGKLYKFVLAWLGSPDDRFALVPIAMYFFVAAGFACVFLWAVLHGMLTDIEGPKYEMLENELELERLEKEEHQNPWA